MLCELAKLIGRKRIRQIGLLMNVDDRFVGAKCNTGLLHLLQSLCTKILPTLSYGAQT